MAWVQRYRGFFQSSGLGACTVFIFKQDYTGSLEDITIQADGINITVETKDYYEPIISTSAEIAIVNDKDDFYELDELFSVSDNEYLVTIISDTYYLFRGYIPCEVVEQVWLRKGIVALNATCNLNRLDQYKPTILSDPGIVSLMDLIEHCLSFTGLDLLIYVNITLRADNADPPNTTNNTCFDQTYIDTDLYYEDSVTVKDCRTILESILKSFGCVIYYYNDKWYIERVVDLGSVTKHYVVYNNGSYWTTDDVANTHFILGDDSTSNLRCINANQTIKYCPGLHSIEITKNEKARENFANYTFDDITKVQTLSTLEYVSPAYQHWQTINESYVTTQHFHNAYGFKNGVIVSDDYDDEYSPDTPRHLIDWNVSSFQENTLRASFIGVYTSFNLELNEAQTTSVTITYKFKIPQNFIDYMNTLSGGGNLWVTDHLLKTPENYVFSARFFINQPGMLWLHYDSSTSSYAFRTQTNLCKYDGNYDPGIITVDIPFSDFTDKENYICEFSKTVELNPDSAVGNRFIVGVCEIGYKDITEIEGYKNVQFSIRDSMIGDLFITVEDTLDDNLIIGTINNDFIQVQKESVDLFDSNTDRVYCIYVNPDRIHWIYTGWGGPWKDQFWASISDNLYLIEHLIRDRFQLYNKVRREITSDVKSNELLQPFALVDSQFGETGDGTVQTYYLAPNVYRVIGIGTTFTSMFVAGDRILVEGEQVHIITSVLSNTQMVVSTAWDNPNVTGLWYAKGKTFYINGFRYCPNEVNDIYYNMSLKEYVDNENIT